MHDLLTKIDIVVLSSVALVSCWIAYRYFKQYRALKRLETSFQTYRNNSYKSFLNRFYSNKNNSL